MRLETRLVNNGFVIVDILTHRHWPPDCYVLRVIVAVLGCVGSESDCRGFVMFMIRDKLGARPKIEQANQFSTQGRYIFW